MPPKRMYPGVTSYADRHGRRRWRVRLGGRQAELGATFGGEEFEARYAAFLAAEPKPVEPAHAVGTFGALITAYKQSREFTGYAPDTKIGYQRFFNMLKPLADLPAGDRWFQTHHAQALLDRIKTDGARNTARKKLGVLMRFAMRKGIRHSDPVTATASGYTQGDGIQPWTPEQVALVLSRHPLDTQTGLALRLLYETGAALVDVVNLGPDNLQDGCIIYKRQKLGKRNAAPAVCPLSPELLARLAEITAPTFLHVNGQPRSHKGLGTKVRAIADECGFAGSAHGIRKARANALWAAGADVQGVAAILGHGEVKTTQHYTRAANRVEIAKKAASMTNLNPKT